MELISYAASESLVSFPRPHPASNCLQYILPPVMESWAVAWEQDYSFSTQCELESFLPMVAAEGYGVGVEVGVGLNGKEEGLGLNGMVLRLKLVWGLHAVTDLTVWDSSMVYLERDTENVFSARYRSLNQRTYQGMSKTDCEF